MREVHRLFLHILGGFAVSICIALVFVYLFNTGMIMSAVIGGGVVLIWMNLLGGNYLIEDFWREILR
jgi:hypothetical protein